MGVVKPLPVVNGAVQLVGKCAFAQLADYL